jgi:hypothetical protein
MIVRPVRSIVVRVLAAISDMNSQDIERMRRAVHRNALHTGFLCGLGAGIIAGLLIGVFVMGQVYGR